MVRGKNDDDDEELKDMKFGDSPYSKMRTSSRGRDSQTKLRRLDTFSPRKS